VSDYAQWQAHTQEFYFYVGRCILKYQGIEDMLKFVFASALDKKPEEIGDLYVDKDLQRKFQLVGIAITSRKSDPQLTEWTEIKRKIQQAADKRNTIAHSEPSIYSGGISIDFEAHPPTARRLGPQQWQARKKTKSGGETITTLDDLKSFLVELESLDTRLLTFVNLLRNEHRN
jgi:hypothetical protein